MKFANPEERELWERLVAGMANLDGVSSTNAVAWADRVVQAYRLRRSDRDIT
jgi:hypothetical protein